MDVTADGVNVAFCSGPLPYIYRLESAEPPLAVGPADGSTTSTQSLCFSRDDSLLYFEHRTSAIRYDLWKVAVDGTGAQVILNTADDETNPCEAMVNGQPRLIYREGWWPVNLFSLDMSWQNRTQITSDGASYGPAASSDGTLVAYHVAASYGYLDIWLMNSDGSNKRALTSDGGANPEGWPTFITTTSGTELVAYERINPGTGFTEIWLTDLDGLVHEPLIVVPNRHVLQPEFATTALGCPKGALYYVVADTYDAPAEVWRAPIGFVDCNENGVDDQLDLQPRLAYAAAQDWPTGGVAARLVSADFNKDGLADLAVTNLTTDNVIILAGRPEGGFSQVGDYYTGDNPEGVAAADFDGDGWVDLAVVNVLSHDMIVLRNVGGTTFAQLDHQTLRVNPMFVRAGDLDRDGDVDLVVSLPSVWAAPNDTVDVRLNDGNGGFDTSLEYTVGSCPAGVALSDLDKDDWIDVVACNMQGNSVSVLRNSGSGTFGPPVNHAVGMLPFMVAAGDLNQDGAPDLAVVNYDSQTVSILMNDGQGIFAVSGQHAAQGSATCPVIADLNGDGHADVAVSTFNPPAIRILENQGDGTLEAVQSLVGTGDRAQELIAADFNQDGRPDLALANYNGNDVSVFLNDTKPTSQDLNQNQIPDECEADCNGNGVLDAVEIAEGALADVDGDGEPDSCALKPSHVRVVDTRATGTGDGTSWVNAFTDLQTALTAVDGSAGTITELWVAQGTYRPAAAGASRKSTFRLRNGLAIYGGFAGEELSLDQRDHRKHVTILSGDLNGDDVGFLYASDNCYHVVSADTPAASGTLDGLVITGGRADGAGHMDGGGLYIKDPQVSLSGCTFIRNTAARYGAGLYVQSIWQTAIDGCTFVSNRCEGDGGAACLSGGSFECTNSTFHGNYAGRAGGAIYAIYGATPWIKFSTFTGNQAVKSGGAVAVVSTYYTGWADLESCIFWGDAASDGPELAIAADPYTGLSSVAASGCVVEGGEAGVSVGVNSILTWDASNIDRDPRLTPDGHLRGAAGAAVTAAADPPAVDRDGDARPAGAGLQAGSDQYADGDEDGLPDAWEKRFGMNPGSADANSNNIPDGEEDTDGDGIGDLQEYALFSSNPVAPPFFVDGANGDNANDGREPVGQGGTSGPKKTIQAALNVARDGDTVLVLPGIYAGAGNRNLDFAGKAVIVRAAAGAGQTRIDCGSAGRAVDPQRLYGAACALAGFTVAGGVGTEGGAVQLRESRLLLVDCVLTSNAATVAGGGLHARSGSLTLADVRVGPNTAPSADAGLLATSRVQLEGPMSVETGMLKALSSQFEGPGSIDLGLSATLRVSGSVANAPPTVIRSDLGGSGTLVIDYGQALTVGGSAIVEMRDEAGVPGRIDVLGTLTLEEQATVRRTQMNVKAASVATSASISENEIDLAGALASGGQFFVQGQASVQDNVIFSEGDRYLDLDPDPQGQHPSISGNIVHVIVRDEPVFPAGALLELRARDYDCGTAANPECRSGAYAAPGSPGFTADPSQNWVLETLELLPGARLNLTNRPGFRYQSDTSHPETVYVRNLVLHENAVLNTALQTLYYENLVQGGGSRIVDEPLLGFSLGIIAMDDLTESPFNEFDIRIHSRIRDPLDMQPLPPAPALEGVVRLLPHVRGPGNGVMEMATRAANKQSASSVAAKGSFARAGDEDISVTFEYSFRQADENTVINVYLSDSPSVGKRVFKVAELRPPAPGSSGGTGTDQFARFSGEFPRVAPGVYDLNFTRGTYIELELRGADSCVRIDNFDPYVKCEDCATFDPDRAVTYRDYLILLAETGQTVPSGRKCLDLSSDGYVDLGDTLLWDVIYKSGFDLCPEFIDAAAMPVARAAAANEPAAGFQATASVPQPRMLVAGKPVQNDGDGHPDRLYRLPPEAGSSGAGLALACPDGIDCEYGISRLIQDPAGNAVVVHGMNGLLRVDGGRPIVAPAVKPFQGRSVVVGLQSDGKGTPLVDAAYATGSDSHVYVAPVTVIVPAAGTVPEHAYRAVARLLLGDEARNYQVEALFGIDPATDSDPCANCTPTVPDGSCRPLCDFSGIREISVDGHGNLLVLASVDDNDNDWLLVYGENAPGAPRAKTRIGELFEAADVAAPRSPSTMLVSPHASGYLFLTSSIGKLNRLTTPIYRLSFDPSSASVGFAGMVEIEHPAPGAGANQIGNTAMIASLQMDADGSLYAVGFSAPRYDDDWDGSEQLFTLATLGLVPRTAEWRTVAAQAAVFTAAPLAGGELGLALSAILLGSPAGDLNGDGRVDGADVEAFVSCATGPNMGPVGAGCAASDLDGDGDSDQSDFGLLQVLLSPVASGDTPGE